MIDRELYEAVSHGAFLGPAQKLPIYRVVISGGQALEPEKVEVQPFCETGFSTFHTPTYVIGQVYNFYNYWDAFRFYRKRGSE